MRQTPIIVVTLHSKADGHLSIIADFVNTTGRATKVGCYGIPPRFRPMALDALARLLEDSDERTYFSNRAMFHRIMEPYGDVAP